jgi:hypothetical protein
MFDELSERSPSYDPIVAEVRAARAALLEAAGNDIHQFCRRAREKQQASGHPVVVDQSGPSPMPASSERESRQTG